MKASSGGKAKTMKLEVRQLTQNLWPALESLFEGGGACARCWCMYWRIGSEYRKRLPAENMEALHEIVENGPPPGLLVFDGDLAVGWCQLTPREVLSWLERSRKLARVDDLPVWWLSCFYIRKGYRKRGVTSALIGAALEVTRRAGAHALEAYPLDVALTNSSSFTGYASAFERAGFKVVARHFPPQPIMRYAFEREHEVVCD